MALVFWLSLAFVAYTYFGYALLLVVLARFRKKPVHTAAILPTVSVVMAAHNEAINLPAKLANLRALDYPPELLQIVVVSDGSTDGTAEVLEAHRPDVSSVLLAKPEGKSSALNHGVAQATGELLFLCDVRQRIAQDALRHLVMAFFDTTVGAVSGELHLEPADGGEASGLGIYWKIEKLVRKLEAQTGSVVGVTGAIYAVRRELYVPLPAGTLLDDVLVPMNVARKGHRVLFEPRAMAVDTIFNDPGKEFSRKVRTLTGNYQLVKLAPWLLTPGNPLLFRFVSHKLLRLAVPFALTAMLVSSALAGGLQMGTFLFFQVVFYGFAAAGTLLPRLQTVRPVAVAHTFVLLNYAALLAFRNAVLGRSKVWTR